MEPIVRKPHEDIERLIRRFKKVSKDSTLELKKCRYYMKPSEVKNRANAAKKHLKKRDKRKEEAIRLAKNTKKRRGWSLPTKKKGPRDDRRNSR